MSIVSRDSYMTGTQLVDGLRAAFDARVTHAFCITEAEAEEMLQNHPAEVLLEALRLTGRWLTREQQKGNSYLEEEIMLELQDRIVKIDAETRRMSFGERKRYGHHRVAADAVAA